MYFRYVFCFYYNDITIDGINDLDNNIDNDNNDHNNSKNNRNDNHFDNNNDTDHENKKLKTHSLAKEHQPNNVNSPIQSISVMRTG